MADRTNEQWLEDLQADVSVRAEAISDLTERLARGLTYYLSHDRSDLSDRSSEEIQQMAQDVRFLQWQGARESTEALLRSRASVLERFHYYQRLLGLKSDDESTPEILPLDRREMTEELAEVGGVNILRSSLERRHDAGPQHIGTGGAACMGGEH